MFGDCKIRWANRLVVGVLGEVAKRQGLNKQDTITTFIKAKDRGVSACFWNVLAEKAGIETLGTLFNGVNYCNDCRKFHLEEVDPNKTRVYLGEYMKTLPK